MPSYAWDVQAAAFMPDLLSRFGLPDSIAG
jgi:hypothetical protein